MKARKLVAVDPGINGCGVAIFNMDTKELVHASYVESIKARDRAKLDLVVRARVLANDVSGLIDLQISSLGLSGPDKVVIELPQVYAGSKQKGPPEDLIKLTLVAGMIFGAFSEDAKELQVYRPREWKGQLPPNICARRVLHRLLPGEEKVITNYVNFVDDLQVAEAEGKEIGGTDHNTFDAIGIGMKALGRFEAVKA